MENLGQAVGQAAAEAGAKVTEVQEALPLPQPKSEGIGWGSSIALIVGLVAAGAILKFGCKKLKK